MLVVSALVFIVQTKALGDSSSYILSEEASSDEIEAYRESKGLDDSILIRYGRFLLSFFSLDWGTSVSGQDIRNIVSERFPVTIALSFFSLILALLISIPWVISSVNRKGGFADKSLSFFSLVLLSLPSFLIALILSLVFGLYLEWFPVAGYIAPGYSLSGFFRTLFLPSLTLALLHLSLFMRMFREGILDNLDKPYTLSLKAQGASHLDLILHSALKPALPMMLSLVFQSLATSFSGAAIVESVFALPGLGALLVKSALSRDVELAGTILMVVAFMVSIAFLLSEALSRLVDPRTRRAK